MGTSKTKTTKKTTAKPKAKKSAAKKAVTKKKVVAKKPAAKKATKKNVVAKKKTAAKKKSTTTKKRVVKKKDEELLTLHLHHEAPHLEPVIPRLPEMPEPPAPAEMGICKHCHILPAAAFELVIVMTCLVFSLSAVLLTSTQTIEHQQDVIATLQDVKMEVYVRR